MNPSEQDNVRANYRMKTAASMAFIFLSLFLLAATIYAFKSIHYVGSGVSATNTISVTGDGEVFAVPDTATFSVTIQERAKDVKTAQTAATKKNNDVIAYLKAAGVEEKDIQTADYNVSPQYEYSNGACTNGYCQPGTQTRRGNCSQVSAQREHRLSQVFRLPLTIRTSWKLTLETRQSPTQRRRQISLRHRSEYRSCAS
jgi:hypothetical protein